MVNGNRHTLIAACRTFLLWVQLSVGARYRGPSSNSAESSAKPFSFVDSSQCPHTPQSQGKIKTMACTKVAHCCSWPYSQNIRTCLPTRCYAPTIARTWACLLPHSSPYSASLWTAKAGGGGDGLETPAGFISRKTVDQELLLRNEYLVTENRILRNQVTGRMRLTDGERKALADIGQKLGKQALKDVATISHLIPSWPGTANSLRRNLTAPHSARLRPPHDRP